MISKQEKELMKNFKVEELEERLEMKLWDGHGKRCGASGGNCINPAEHQ